MGDAVGADFVVLLGGGFILARSTRVAQVGVDDGGGRDGGWKRREGGHDYGKSSQAEPSLSLSSL